MQSAFHRRHRTRRVPSRAVCPNQHRKRFKNNAAIFCNPSSDAGSSQRSKRSAQNDVCENDVCGAATIVTAPYIDVLAVLAADRRGFRSQRWHGRGRGRAAAAAAHSGTCAGLALPRAAHAAWAAGWHGFHWPTKDSDLGATEREEQSGDRCSCSNGRY